MRGVGGLVVSTCSVLAALAAAGCGVEVDGADSPSGAVTTSASASPAGNAVVRLTEDDLQAVLLTPDEFDADFRVAALDGVYDIDCLDQVDFDEEQPDTVENTLEGDSMFGLPVVKTGIASLPSAEAAEKLVDEIRTTIAGCVAVRQKDGEFVTKIDFSFAADVFSPAEVDEQVNVVARGVLTEAGGDTKALDLPITTRISVVRLGNQVAITGLSAIEEDDRASIESESLVRMVLARLRATATGDPLPELPPLVIDVSGVEDMLQYVR
jgi:hypothetical protein